MSTPFEIVYLDPKTLVPYEANAKKHDETQIRDLAAAISKRGFDQPITDYDAIKLQKELEELVLGDEVVIGFDERELSVLVGSMTEDMATDSLVMDLGHESVRQHEEHEEISREVAESELRVIDVLGFKTLPAGSALVVGDLLAHMEEVTGEAFVAYAKRVSEEAVDGEEA